MQEKRTDMVLQKMKMLVYLFFSSQRRNSTALEISLFQIQTVRPPVQPIVDLPNPVTEGSHVRFEAATTDSAVSDVEPESMEILMMVER